MKKIDLQNYAGSVEINGDPKNNGWNELIIRANGNLIQEFRIQNLKEEDYRKMAELFLMAATKLGPFL